MRRDDADEALVELALGLLAQEQEPASDGAAEAIWRRFELERAPRRLRAARLQRWLAWLQLAIAAASLLVIGIGWVLLGGLERWLGPSGAEASSPVLAIAIVCFAALATALGLSFGRWMEGS